MRNADERCLDTTEAVEAAVDMLTEAVNLAIDKFLLKSIDTNRNVFSNLPDDIILLQKLKTRCLRALQRMSQRATPRAQAHQLVSERLSLIEVELSRLLRKHFSGKIHARLKNVVPGPFMYKEINRISGRKAGLSVKCMKDTPGNSVVD